MVEMINAISTNKTDFFREKIHFDFLAENVFPKLESQRVIRCWSAASSTGEEPYTLAITLLEHFGIENFKDIKILATDISTKVLDDAEQGIYSTDVVSPIPALLLKKYFYKGYNNWAGRYLAKECLKDMVFFRRLNLMKKFPLTAKFDFILCRNVMIYFDKPTREDLVNRLAQQLAPGGHLIIGNSESLSGIRTDLKYVQPAIYQRVR